MKKEMKGEMTNEKESMCGCTTQDDDNEVSEIEQVLHNKIITK